MSLASTHRAQRTAGLPPLLSVGEAARLLGSGRSTLYAAIRSGYSSVPVVRIGRQWRVPLAAVERILDGTVVSGVRTAGHDEAQLLVPPGACPSCGAPAASSNRPTWSDALRSSLPTASV
jgi:excisionase family DNA binding protein